MSLRLTPTLILDSNLYQKTWKDVVYNNMNSYLYSIGKFKLLTDRGKIMRSIGRNASVIYEELYFYHALIRYFINARETLTKSGITDFATSKEDYDFACIRKTIFCKYKSTKIFDDLYKMSGLSKDLLDGLDFMIFDPSGFGDELVTNGNFASPADGFGHLVGFTAYTLPIIYTDVVVSGQFRYNTEINLMPTPEPLIIDSIYKITFDIIDLNVNTLQLEDVNGSIIETFTTIGSKSIVFIATTTSIFLHSFNLTIIDNVSIKKVIEGIDSDNDFIII